jgi:uncharacterized protein (TIRG00374 family)
VKFKNLIGIALSIGLIVWLLWGVDWREAGAALKQVELSYLAVMSAVFIVQIYVRALRWRFLLPAQYQSGSTRDLFDSIMVGQLANFVLPFRAGEFARPAMLAKVSQVDFGTGFGSVVLERLFDLLAVLLTFAVVVRGIPDLPSWVGLGAESLLYVALTIAAFFVGAVLFPRLGSQIVSRTLTIFPARFSASIKGFSDGVFRTASVLKSSGQVFAVVFFTALVWFGNYLFFYFTFPALGWEPSFFEAVALTVIVALSVAAPSAPGFIGVYQTACVAGFVLFGRTPANGLAFSVVNHLLQYLLIVIIGVSVLYRRGLKLSNLK